MRDRDNRLVLATSGRQLAKLRCKVAVFIPRSGLRVTCQPLRSTVPLNVPSRRSVPSGASSASAGIVCSASSSSSSVVATMSEPTSDESGGTASAAATTGAGGATPRPPAGAYRGRFFRKTLRSFSRFGCPDAQTPPSPLVGEGGRGMRGKRRGNAANRALLLRTLPLRAPAGGGTGGVRRQRAAARRAGGTRG